MRTFLVLVSLGWLMSQSWIVLFGYLVLIAAAIVILWFVSVTVERRAVSPSRGGNGIDHNYVAALEAIVVAAESEVVTLRAELQQCRSAAAAAAEPDPKTALYRRVGLADSAPEWLISAARRAYRVALHPDQHPPHRKQEAEHRFKLAESAFDAIAAQRASA